MNIRLKKLGQSGFDHVLLVVAFVVVFALIGAFLLVESHAATTTCVNNTNTGTNRCVNLHAGSLTGICLNGTTLTNCSNTSGDNMWINPTGSTFKLQNKNSQCLSDPGGKVQTVSGVKNRVPVSLGSCSSAYTTWHWSGGELVNTAGSNRCLNAGGGISLGAQIIVYACGSTTTSNETWKSVYVKSAAPAPVTTTSSGLLNVPCVRTGNTGADIANCAKTQLAYWNGNSSKHSKLIQTYCDNTGACMGGEWCAGFVSYVLKQSGHGVGDVFLAKNFSLLPSEFTFQSKPVLGAIQYTGGSGNAGHVQVVVNTSPLTFISGNAGGNSERQTSGWTGTLYGYAVRK